MPIVSISQGFIFISNPKAASTSIQHALASYQDRPELDLIARSGLFTRRHLPAVEVRDVVGQRIWDRMFKFGVVRDPLDWFVSVVAYHAVRNALEVPVTRKLHSGDVELGYERLKEYRAQPSSNTAAQWAYLCDRDRMPLVDMLIAVDRLPKEWPVLLARLGLDFVSLSRLNVTNHPSAADWLTGPAKALIRRLWVHDIELYEGALDVQL